MAKGKSNAIDMAGKRFGHLIVQKRVENKVSANGLQTFAVWQCLCDCGNTTNVLGCSLRKGNTKSCGCQRSKTLSHLYTTHGKSKTRIYEIWAGMKKRCNNPRSSVYKYYGGRGITVCDKWESDFESFYEWALQNGYDDSLSIDRMDVNLGYSPQNCKWVTDKEQANNTRGNRRIKYLGMNKTLSEWGDYLGENPRLISWRLNHGWSEMGALLGDKTYRSEIQTKAGD